MQVVVLCCVQRSVVLCTACVSRTGCVKKKTATRRRAYDFLDPRPQIILEAVKLYVEIF